MHKSRGTRKTQKVCKTCKFNKIKGKFENVGEIIFFQILKFWRMKIENSFSEQMKLGTFTTESETFPEIGAKSEPGGNAPLPHGWWMLVLSTPIVRKIFDG